MGWAPREGRGGLEHQLKSERDEIRSRFFTDRSSGSSLSDAAWLPAAPPTMRDEVLATSLRTRAGACACAWLHGWEGCGLRSAGVMGDVVVVLRGSFGETNRMAVV